VTTVIPAPWFGTDLDGAVAYLREKRDRHPDVRNAVDVTALALIGYVLRVGVGHSAQERCELVALIVQAAEVART
jgi:hypothetical protein